MLPGGEDLASQLFKFTAGLPVAGTRGPFGVISQTVSLESEEMVSEVEMRIFDPFFAVASGVSGTVVSTANVTVKPDGAGDVLLVTPGPPESGIATWGARSWTRSWCQPLS